MSAKNGKPCKKCGTSEWYNDGKCVSCRKEYNRRYSQDNSAAKNEYQRRYRKENPAAEKERSRRWRQGNPAEAKEYKLRYRQEHSAAIKEYNRRYYEENSAAMNESGRRWRQTNPESVASSKHRYRTRKTSAGGSYTAAEWKALVEHYRGKCLCCGRDDVKLTADHVVPVTKGGTSNIDNIQPLCGSCNSRKGDKATDYRPGSGLGRWIQRKIFGR